MGFPYLNSWPYGPMAIWPKLHFCIGPDGRVALWPYGHMAKQRVCIGANGQMVIQHGFPLFLIYPNSWPYGPMAIWPKRRFCIGPDGPVAQWPYGHMAKQQFCIGPNGQMVIQHGFPLFLIYLNSWPYGPMAIWPKLHFCIGPDGPWPYGHMAIWPNSSFA